jgi:hypothetical protein
MIHDCSNATYAGFALSPFKLAHRMLSFTAATQYEEGNAIGHVL